MDPRKKTAAESLAAGSSQAEAARQAGVNRSTVLRWLDDPEFQALLQEVDPSSDALTGLGVLVPKALEMLNRAMTTGDIPATKARVALDIVKAAAGLKQGDPGGESSLAQRLQQLDEANVGSD